jgi:hypothetical protein
MAWLAWRLCKRARGTKAFTLSLFVGIPVIYEPFNFVVIFGGLDSNYSQLLFWAGLLNLTQRYIDSTTLSLADEQVRIQAMKPVMQRRPQSVLAGRSF